MKASILSVALLCIPLIVGCGSDKTSTEKESPKQEVKVVWEEFEIQALGNTMANMTYDVKNITVQEGSMVRITLINKGSDPAMIHNLLIVNYGKREEIALKSVEAGLDKEFVAEDKNIIAASPLANPGQSVTFEFKAPAKGNYEFFCSYPGHYQKMRGYFFVK